MKLRTVTKASLWITLLAVVLGAPAAPCHAEEYSSSVVGTEFDFILDTDPSAFLCLEYKGKGTREMPDKRGPSPLFQEAFILVSYFDDGTSIDIAIDADFETAERARSEALRYTPRLGKLPTSLRHGVERVVVHKGDATAFSDVGLIVLYSQNATKRISTHDLEETVFHESVHAAWDKRHATSPEWLQAQKSDDEFITRYARKNPNGEDLAESALFAYTLLHHPERIPAADAEKIRGAIPARIAFVKTLLPPDEPIKYQVGPKYPCDGSGTTFTVVAPDAVCDVDITRVGTLSDILSNALMRGLHQEESRVSSFLSRAIDKWSSAQELIKATSVEFGFDEATLNAQVQEFLHCNCDHGELLEPTRSRDIGPRQPGGAGSTPTVAPASQDDDQSGQSNSLLRVIAALLLLLLIVNASMLVVLIRRSR